MCPLHDLYRSHLHIPLLLLGSVLVTGTALAATTAELEPSYQRQGEASRRPAVRSPNSRLPEELRAELGDLAPRQRGYAERRASTESKSHEDPIYRAASLAARQTASRWAEPAGRRQLYRLGFTRGSRRALDDPHLAEWDFRQGRFRGEDDPQAHSAGGQVGHEAAVNHAESNALERVAEQFHDLRVEPRREATPALRPDWQPPEIVAPRIEEAFHEVPLRHFWQGGDSRQPSPRQLLRHTGWRSHYSGDWCDPARGWSHWRRHGERSVLWEQLDEADREHFAVLFRQTFAAEISRRAAEFSDTVFDHGFDDGWRWGAEVSFEWAYRRGYHQGFAATHQRAAEVAYLDSYSTAWRGAYLDEFERWSSTAQLEIVTVELTDGSDDGVFEPGEEVLANWRLVNFGGADTEISVSLDGLVLLTGDLHRVRLPRRRALRGSRPLAVVIEPATRPRSTVRLSFRAGALQRDLELAVAYPLQLERSVVLGAHDSLAGWAELQVEVVNISRRAVPANFELLGPAGELVSADPTPDLMASGERRRLTFHLGGVEPLAFLAGELQVSLVARSAAFVHDRMNYRFPELAADLDNRDLLRFMVQLARRPIASNSEIERAQGLMVRRLQLDWTAAVAAKGNPYRDDYRAGSRRTALGDLVVTAAAIGGDRHQVFVDLAPRLDRMAGELPGSHPFLRRWARKLVRRLS